MKSRLVIKAREIRYDVSSISLDLEKIFHCIRTIGKFTGER